MNFHSEQCPGSVVTLINAIYAVCFVVINVGMIWDNMRGTDVFHVPWIRDVPKGCQGDQKFSHPVRLYSPFRHPCCLVIQVSAIWGCDAQGPGVYSW